MRKAIVLAVTALMALAFVGCGGGNDVESASVAADPLVSGTAGAGSGGSGEDKPDAAAAGKSDAAAAGKPDAQAATNASESGNSSGGSTMSDPAPEHEAGPWNIPQKTYAAYDRFSGDKLDSPTLTVRGVWADRIEFDYAKSDGTWNGVSVNLDSSGRGSVQIDGVTFDVVLGDGFIEVDEIEGMGAMAYVFK